MNYILMKDWIRFWSKVAMTDDCWLWTASTQNGYGRIGSWQGSGNVPRLAHRVAYELLVGPIPEGLTIDHLCRNRGCVNPQHMEVVTQKVNLLRGESPSSRNARKTHCPQGHEYDEENTRITSGGVRQCRTCDGERHLKARS